MNFDLTSVEFLGTIGIVIIAIINSFKDKLTPTMMILVKAIVLVILITLAIIGITIVEKKDDIIAIIQGVWRGIIAFGSAYGLGFAVNKGITNMKK